MTDKTRKLEDRSSAVKTPRGHIPVSLHPLTTPTPGLIPAAYTLPTDVAAMSRHGPPHPHLTPYSSMISPSFAIPHPLTMSGPAAHPGSAISNDLGPPIFMPSLNLGTPKSSPSVNAKPIKSSTLVPLGHVTSTHETTSSSGTSLSSPTEMFQQNAIICHSPFSTQPISSVPKSIATFPSKINSHVNSVRKAKPETTTGKPSTQPVPLQNVKQVGHPQGSPSPGPTNPYSPNSLANMGINLTTSMGISLVKPTVARPTTAAINIPDMTSGSHMTYATPTSYQGSSMQYGVVPVVGGAKGGIGTKGFAKQDIGFEHSKPEAGGVTVMTLASGLAGGQTLVCTEGLPPPVPYVTTPSTASSSSMSYPSTTADQRNDRMPSINHHYPADASSVQDAIYCSSGPQDSIPWPEAMSKNIIIPAPNLTGKDIANLTSSASSPLPNEKGINDLQWPQPTTSTEHTHSEGNVHPLDMTTGTGHSPPPQSNHPLDPNLCSTSSGNVIFGMGGHGTQGSSSSRPSILRKRPLESNRSTDSLSSPSSSSPGHTLLTRLPTSNSSLKPNLISNEVGGSLSGFHDNHMIRDNLEIASPRKRPRKQQFDSMNDNHCPPDLQCETLNTHKLSSSIHHSMIAHERLPGPLPLKNKGHNEQWTDNGKSQKDVEILYLSQLRRSQYPMLQLCKKTHRTAHNHFRRHADIKHHDESSTTITEVCNSESTWLRSSGWKLHHLNCHLVEMEGLENEMLEMIEDIEETTSKVCNSLSHEELKESQQQVVDSLLQDTKERTKRSLLHIQETRDKMYKILDVNGKVIETMKKFTTHLPIPLSITSTLVPPTSKS